MYDNTLKEHACTIAYIFWKPNNIESLHIPVSGTLPVAT
jgi:hypothetical protein